MPFQKVGDNDYVSPSGRHYTEAQVKLYYATKGFKKPRMKKMKESKDVMENVKLDFTIPCTVMESSISDTGKSWIKIGGTALEQGVSENKNIYTIDNLKENDGRKFKFLVGHPENPEDHVCGVGELKLMDGKLVHEGKVRNTATHPDVVENIIDGFWGPSIHASAKKITRTTEGKYAIEGLSIDGVGLVAFQGVKNASIDYAIAESFKTDVNDEMESSEEDDIENEEEDEIMAEETLKAPETAVVQESEKVKALEAEIKALREEKKQAIVDKIIETNKELKKEDLIKESEERLRLVLEYETKLASKKVDEGKAIVEGASETPKAEEAILEKDGSVTVSESAYKKFNEELRERVR